VIRLEDTDGDGQFDQRVVFAEGLMFPEGALWYDGSLYVAAPPSIWKLTDTDGDGRADRREEWFQGKTLTGCANDLHGPFLGPDGRIYWCKGAFARQTYERVGKHLRVIPSLPITTPAQPAPAAPPRFPFPTWSTRASHIFRCRPDGSELEVVMTGGMDNPVDVVFTPAGERIFTTTFLQHPGGGRRDGLIHAVYGGVYGKLHDVLEGHPRTGELMPPLAHLSPAAPCGLARYASDAFGQAYRDNLFAALFNLHKVTRHQVLPDGAGLRSVDDDFVVSDNLDFHPTDVQEDGDGSLLIVDTGGWYKLCCPTSQLWKPDVLGAIYRVRRTSAPRSDDPYGKQLGWAALTPRQLAKLLADRRPAVRRRASAMLARRGADALPVLDLELREAAPDAVELRREIVWVLTRFDQTDARAAVRSALRDADETVRQVALHAISLTRDAAAVPQLLELLQSGPPANRRLAAEALGRIGDKAAVPTLLAVAATPHDRPLEHALIYALIEIDDAAATAAGLKHASLHTQRVALIALGEMPSGKLDPQVVAELLLSPDAAVKQAAAWVAARHADWGGALAGFFRTRLNASDLTDSEAREIEAQLSRFARDAAIQELLATSLRGDSATKRGRLLALRVMAQSGLKDLPAAWASELARMLSGDDTELLAAAVAAARAFAGVKQPALELTAGLLRAARHAAAPMAVRLDALAAIPGGLSRVEPELFEFLCGHLNPDTPLQVRSAAADVLSRARLDATQLAALTETVRRVGPLEVDRLVAAFAHGASADMVAKLLIALQASPSVSGVRMDTLKPIVAKHGPSVQQQAEAVYGRINVDLAKQRAKLEEILAAVKPGDVRRGQAVFASSKAACSACHAMGYLGGNLGPDLTRIGQIRSDRDLLEAIVFPSASLVRSYEPLAVATRDGKVFSGLVRRETPDEIVLATGATEEVRIARADIEETGPGTVSIMPAGLDQQLTMQELADLVAFLKAANK
jgi:putative membrane-bound dehydrogenase-like protein